jgi:hypothetical protein
MATTTCDDAVAVSNQSLEEQGHWNACMRRAGLELERELKTPECGEAWGLTSAWDAVTISRKFTGTASARLSMAAPARLDINARLAMRRGCSIARSLVCGYLLSYLQILHLLLAPQSTAPSQQSPRINTHSTTKKPRFSWASESTLN